MRVVFMGTPLFAQKVLMALIGSRHDVVGVITRPDAVRARGKQLVASPVKTCALEHDVTVLEFSSLRSDEAYEALVALEPDVICVAAYGAILPKRILDYPKFGCLNVHGSLLPRWRGAAPVERAILSGDERTGIGIMRMEEGLDTGAVSAVRCVEIGDKSAQELSSELATLGGEALVGVLDELEERGVVTWSDQPDEGVTYAEKIGKAELNISPDMDGVSASRHVRASSDNHPCRCMVSGKRLAVLEVADADNDLELTAGEVAFEAKRLYFGFVSGALEILRVKPDGKKEMSAKAFAAGIQGIKNGGITWGSCDE